MKPKKSFEDAMNRLQEIVEILESGEASLEASMTLFEEGAKLSKECYAILSRAEQKITDFTSLPLPVEEKNEK